MFFSPMQENQYWYICLKCSVKNSDLSIYQSDDYKQLVAKDLRTGITKHIFSERDNAEKALARLGTDWNLCVADIPHNLVEVNPKTQAYQFNPRKIESAVIRITEIVLHPLFRSEPEIQVTKL